MPAVEMSADGIRAGPWLWISFQRTLRVPVSSETYPLPPGLGSFPVRRVEDHLDRLPSAWAGDDAFLPMYQREALWIAFRRPAWRPCAVQVGVGTVNAVSGEPWDAVLRGDPQDYVVVPDQPWLDGINTGDGSVRQFVAMPLGSGATVEAAVTGAEVAGGIQLAVFEPRPGRFPTEAPAEEDLATEMPMGIGAGGQVRQRIRLDPHGIDSWAQHDPVTVVVHILNSERYREVTGEDPPPTPIDAHKYTRHGLPWFDLYEEDPGDDRPPAQFGALAAAGEGDDDVAIPSSQIKPLPERRGRTP